MNPPRKKEWLSVFVLELASGGRCLDCIHLVIILFYTIPFSNMFKYFCLMPVHFTCNTVFAGALAKGFL
jgi:hypothetical protein